MRTTIDIPDGTYRRLKSSAAQQGSSVKQLILRAVEKEIGATRTGRRVKLPIVRSKEPGTLRITNERIYDIIPFP